MTFYKQYLHKYVGEVFTLYVKQFSNIYFYYNMFNNGIVITRMSRMIINVNKRIVVIKYCNNNESHTTTNENTNN